MVRRRCGGPGRGCRGDAAKVRRACGPQRPPNLKSHHGPSRPEATRAPRATDHPSPPRALPSPTLQHILPPVERAAGSACPNPGAAVDQSRPGPVGPVGSFGLARGAGPASRHPIMMGSGPGGRWSLTARGCRDDGTAPQDREGGGDHTDKGEAGWRGGRDGERWEWGGREKGREGELEGDAAFISAGREEREPESPRSRLPHAATGAHSAARPPLRSGQVSAGAGRPQTVTRKSDGRFRDSEERHGSSLWVGGWASGARHPAEPAGAAAAADSGDHGGAAEAARRRSAPAEGRSNHDDALQMSASQMPAKKSRGMCGFNVWVKRAARLVRPMVIKALGRCPVDCCAGRMSRRAFDHGRSTMLLVQGSRTAPALSR